MKSNVSGWGRPALLAAVVAVLLVACGGGEQVETFRANRVIAFGDETSVINADHSKYSVNAVQLADNPLDLGQHRFIQRGQDVEFRTLGVDLDQVRTRDALLREVGRAAAHVDSHRFADVGVVAVK